jgi:mono/diheme cytochrome c family protein
MSIRSAGFLSAFLLLSACSQKSSPTPAPTLSIEAARAEAEQVFTNRCSLCHGMAGKGDGPAAAGLTPKPRNFGDATWQAQITDEQIERIIRGGGMAVGKSVSMPPNPDLDEAVIRALRAKVRSLQDVKKQP